MELHLVMRKALRDEEKERGRRNERKKNQILEWIREILQKQNNSKEETKKQ